jgi:XapX domain-containing protein
MKYVLGLAISFAIGFITRKLNVPTAAPATFYGCALVLAMTTGYMVGNIGQP